MHLQPARTCFKVRCSFKKTAPATAVNMGARKVRTVASERERYCKEK